MRERPRRRGGPLRDRRHRGRPRGRAAGPRRAALRARRRLLRHRRRPGLRGDASRSGSRGSCWTRSSIPESNDGFALDTLETVPRVLDGLCCAPGLQAHHAGPPGRRADARRPARDRRRSPARRSTGTAGRLRRELRRPAAADRAARPDRHRRPRAHQARAPARRRQGRAGRRRRRRCCASCGRRRNDRFEPAELSIALFVATSCLDTRLPWATGASPADRLAALDAAAAAVPDARLGPVQPRRAGPQRPHGHLPGLAVRARAAGLHAAAAGADADPQRPRRHAHHRRRGPPRGRAHPAARRS